MSLLRPLPVLTCNEMLSLGNRAYRKCDYNRAIAYFGHCIENSFSETRNDLAFGRMYVYYAKSVLVSSRVDVENFYSSIAYRRSYSPTTHYAVAPNTQLTQTSTLSDDIMCIESSDDESSDNTKESTKLQAQAAHIPNLGKDITIKVTSKPVQAPEQDKDAVSASSSDSSEVDDEYCDLDDTVYDETMRSKVFAHCADETSAALQALENARKIFVEHGPDAFSELADCQIALGEYYLKKTMVEAAELELQRTAWSFYHKGISGLDLPNLRRYVLCTFLLGITHIRTNKKAKAICNFQQAKRILEAYKNSVNRNDFRELRGRRLIELLDQYIEDLMDIDTWDSDGDEESAHDANKRFASQDDREEKRRRLQTDEVIVIDDDEEDGILHKDNEDDNSGDELINDEANDIANKKQETISTKVDVDGDDKGGENI